MDNNSIDLSDKEKKLTKQVTVWAVWYEDKFGWGEDRDPAFVLDAFLTREEADAYALAKGGPIDINAGKFDGQEVEGMKLFELVYLNELPVERVRELLKEAESKKLI